MKTIKTKHDYIIDLSLPEGERWAKVIKKERHAASLLIGEALEGLEEYRLARWLKPVISVIYSLRGGLYAGELTSWALGVQRSFRDVLCANLSYELAQAGKALQIKGIPMLGCTAGARWVKNKGMHHFRNMDWPLESIGTHTIVTKYINAPAGVFTSIGFPGYVGVLSGVAAGRFSATINWLDPQKLPSTSGWPPSLLLRHIFETCETIQEAIDMVQMEFLSTPALFMFTGPGSKEAYIVEAIQDDSRVINIGSSGVLAGSNIYQGRGFRKFNKHRKGLSFSEDAEYGEEDYDDMLARQKALEKGLKSITACESARQLFMPLKVWPVNNENTKQKMVLRPEDGRFWVELG